MLLTGRDFRISFMVIGLVLLMNRSWANPTPGIKFVENKNQWPSKVHFSARVPGGRMSIQAGKFQYYFLDEKRVEELHERTHDKRNESDASAPEEMIDGHAIEVQFIGANINSTPLPFGKSREYYNYFLG